eukprot:gnl/TRDRNA2_/TRDRNA2_174650_c0_seq1.p1 gnl/TRDRNA2_/TRDRNA2_174650_c0~~gnl/TRDRNA2_/TRDRNA2_174650_c0_seq1.p1  ORF type:complete len:422 (-),score=74.00 gnl/TRDRNA2_/TRDRNA2_174650_c0_seq1:57-1322(-)
MAERVQTLIVGAGVVGLACARALARAGREVVVVETAGSIGTGTSSRNSEVVHAGIYYPAGSRKARHCVRGGAALLALCEEHGVAHRRCGKLIVATSEAQRADLAKVAAHAEGNGVRLLPLSAADARYMEPEVSCVAALHSPGTAVVDSHGFMEALWADAEAAGAALALRTRIRPGGRLVSSGGGAVVEAESIFERGSDQGSDSSQRFRIEAQEVVNCAGLAAPWVASAIGIPSPAVPVPHFCKGNYYALQGFGSGKPFSRLVYPVPEKNTSGLGVHATVDLAGQVRFGPDVEWLEPRLPGSGRALEEASYNYPTAEGVEVKNGCDEARRLYEVDPRRSESFYGEVRRYWPGLPDDALVADYSGIRPKLSAKGEPAADFGIVAHGNGRPASIVNLFGIESPGLTSALSIADEVLELLGVTVE